MEKMGIVYEKVQQLYEIVNTLERSFEGRKFTLDGHLVGSIGEVLGAYHYGLELLPASTKTHDAKDKYGKKIQIKATQSDKSVGIRSEPDHLIVLKIEKEGRAKEVYNGPGKLAWENAGKIQSNGQRSIGISKLRSLMSVVSEDEKICIINGFKG